MTYDVDTIQLLQAIQLRKRNGEDELKVFATIHRYGRRRHIQLLSHAMRLDIDRQTLLIDTHPYTTLRRRDGGVRRLSHPSYRSSTWGQSLPLEEQG